jgi:hypothetical protein
MVGSAGATGVQLIDVSTGAVRWSQPLSGRTAVALCPAAALVLDQDLGQLKAYDPGSGRGLLDVRILGDVLGCGATGLVLGRGRTVGFVGFGTVPYLGPSG